MMIRTMKRNLVLPLRKEAQLSEGGFTIIETCVALVVMMVVSLATASLFAYAMNSNSGSNDRELAMAIAQRRMERLRNVLFSDTSLNPTVDASGNVTPVVDTASNGGRQYQVTTTIVSSEGGTLKTIRILVTPTGAGPGWSAGTSIFGSVALVSQRSTLATGANRVQ